ncbi:hypothetical protein TWF481_006248 [Arthrobotrys musiformis]|uniref:Uncharacterized protein n=1 Tax=Arthrobotrys musiformis TaxID=47236 RepID=A0AAV9WI42_9PEZI
MSGTQDHEQNVDAQMQLIQAQNSANYYYDAYQSCASQLNSCRQQLLHEQKNVRDLQTHLRSISLELRWYQAAFPNAKDTYHLQTDPSKAANLVAKITLNESEHQPHQLDNKTSTKPRVPRKAPVKRVKRKVRKARAVKPADLRRSLRLQGITVIEEEP